MSNPIKLTEVEGNTIILNAGCIELVRINYEITHVFTADVHGMYKVKETPEEIEALMLRDQFAMSALEGILSSGEKTNSDEVGMISKHAMRVSLKAYSYADAMLKDRKVK